MTDIDSKESYICDCPPSDTVQGIHYNECSSDKRWKRRTKDGFQIFADGTSFGSVRYVLNCLADGNDFSSRKLARIGLFHLKELEKKIDGIKK